MNEAYLLQFLIIFQHISKYLFNDNNLQIYHIISFLCVIKYLSQSLYYLEVDWVLHS